MLSNKMENGKTPETDATDAGRNSQTNTQTNTQANTQANNLYHRMRGDLLNGKFAPGSKLRIRSLMETYEVGQTPLREVLNRLTADGLVENLYQRGFAVVSFSHQELIELYKTRCWLESLALRESMAHATPAWEESLLLACHRLTRVPRSLSADHYEQNPEWAKLHRAYHNTLISQCGSRWLIGFCQQLSDQFYRFRQLANTKSFSTRDTQAEHDGIVKAVLDGNADEAVRRLMQHYEHTADIVLGDQAEQIKNIATA